MLWYVKHCRLFQQLPLADLKKLEQSAQSRTFPSGSAVYAPHDRGEHVLLLESGRVKICHLLPDGRRTILAFIEPGELFGELALLTGGCREELAEAVGRSVVISLPAKDLDEVMERHPGLSLGITKLIGLRRRRVERRLKSLLFRSHREKMLALLLELVEQYGARCPEGVRLEIPLSHQDMASLIGSTRETVTLTLNQLASEGMVRLGRRNLTIVDPLALAEATQRIGCAVPALLMT